MDASSQGTCFHRTEVGPKCFVQRPAVGHGKPDAEKMPPFVRVFKILERSSAVKCCPVVEEKEFTRLERKTSL